MSLTIGKVSDDEQFKSRSCDCNVKHLFNAFVGFRICHKQVCSEMRFVNNEIKYYDICLTALKAMDCPCPDEIQVFFESSIFIFQIYQLFNSGNMRLIRRND